MEFIKKDDFTLKVIKPLEIKEEVFEYDLDFLKQQREAIIKQRDKMIAQKEAELAEVEKLIIEAEKLGIKERSIINIGEVEEGIIKEI